MAFDLSDYITVPQRVAMFYEQNPDGRIVSSEPVIVTIDNRTFIQVTTKVYRSPEDAIPCQATAYEPFPGKTPYTRDSEMMNAETSAIGRAIAAAGIAVNRSLASANEVRARVEDRGEPKPKTRSADSFVNGLVERMSALPEANRRKCKDLFVKKFGKPVNLSNDDYDAADAFVTYWETIAAQLPGAEIVEEPELSE